MCVSLNFIWWKISVNGDPELFMLMVEQSICRPQEGEGRGIPTASSTLNV